MNNSADAWRRWLGLFCLAVAGGMLIWGQTILAPHLKGWGFLIYWLICFFFTMAAIVIALLDVRAVRKKIRRQQQDLIEQTLDELDEETSKKNKD